jgi:hypothetical protein
MIWSKESCLAAVEDLGLFKKVPPVNPQYANPRDFPFILIEEITVNKRK